YRQWRALIPLRTLAPQTFHGQLRWFKPLIRILYRLEGGVELPPKEEGNTLPEKLQGILDALKEGDVVMIFPEGEIWKERFPPIGKFAPGVVYLHRKSGARIVPMAICMSERRWPRRRYVVEIGDPLQIPDSLGERARAASAGAALGAALRRLPGARIRRSDEKWHAARQYSSQRVLLPAGKFPTQPSCPAELCEQQLHARRARRPRRRDQCPRPA